MTAYPNQPSSHFAEAQLIFDAVQSQLSSAEAMTSTHEQIETLVEHEGSEILRCLLQAHLQLRADAEREREAPDAADGAARPHRRDSQRTVASLFGDCVVRRIDFSGRGVKGGLRPLDAELNLPADMYSFGLRKRAAMLAMDVSYDSSTAKFQALIRRGIGKRQLEELAVRAAADFETFYDQRQKLASNCNRSETSDKLLVLTSDGKGVVMRPEGLRPATAKKAAAASRKLQSRLSPGEKANRKRMAEVAAVYDLEPMPRTADDVMPPEKRTPEEAASRPKRPRPQDKRVWASLERSLADVVGECFDEALSRDPQRQRTWVYLVDGNNHQIDTAKSLAAQHNVDLTIIVDFIHVLEYLWKAAWCFHGNGDESVDAWVRVRARSILAGKASDVAAGIRRSATLRGLSDKERGRADACADYLINKRAYLRYDVALAAGLPIATGVIEGACRHVVNDRLGITGARWGLPGAEAILRLRALRSSGDFEEYWQLHVRNEQARNHLVNYATTQRLALKLAA